MSFATVVSERDYHTIVECLRSYDNVGHDSASDEASELQRLGWHVSYHPCDHMENIRHGMVFGSEDNTRVNELIDVYQVLVEDRWVLFLMHCLCLILSRACGHTLTCVGT